uniref:Uncharacterized protein n=1 Tax=Kryptolebias marmoratus TaxID=37003 RepID=A0A3Q3FD73_KRYMA
MLPCFPLYGKKTDFCKLRVSPLVVLCLQLSKTYGPVFQVYFGPKKVVVLAGYRTVKQALVNQADDPFACCQ